MTEEEGVAGSWKDYRKLYNKVFSMLTLTTIYVDIFCQILTIN